MLLPLDRLLFPQNMPAGLDWAILGLWCATFRKTPQPCDPPITVRREGDYWRITDGRHRAVSALISGRTHIEAQETA
jgi:hypothetical protein